MRSLRVLAVALTALLGAGLLGALPVQAAGPKPTKICDAQGHCRWVVVKPGKPGGGGGSGGGSGGGDSDSDGPTPDAQGCIYRIVDPPPPKSDPVWQGHTDGYIYAKACPGVPSAISPGGLSNVELFWSAAPVALKTPRQLAQEALAALTIPKPVIGTSPDAGAGAPTYTGLWTWYWAENWAPITNTRAENGVWAALTITPNTLSFTPGDGSAGSTCAGGGRAYTKSDEQADTNAKSPAGIAPSTVGACGVRYQTAHQAVTATATLGWTVTYNGSDGVTGTLTTNPTTSDVTLQVLQIQTENQNS